MSRKPVLFRVTNNLKIGGITSRLRLVLPRLTEHFQVHVVTYRAEGVLTQEMRDNGISVHHIPFSGKWSPKGLRSLARLLTEKRADVVHTHAFGGNVSGILAASLAGVPVRIGQVHTRQQHWYGSSALHRLKQRMEEYLIHTVCSDVVLFACRASRDYFARHCPVRADKFRIVYNGVDIQRFLHTPVTRNIREMLGIAPERKLLGFVGRLTEGKGLDFAFQFMKRLQKTTREYALVVVGSSGSGDKDKKMQEQADAIVGPQTIYLAGIQRETQDFYRAFDAFFFPSDPWTEALPGVVLEAAASGLPILSRDNPAVREIADFYPRIHFMMDDEDPGQSLDALFHLPVCDTGTITETFSADAMAASTTALYHELLEKKGRL